MGMLLNEYGLFEKDDRGKRIASEEKDILERLGLTNYLRPRARSLAIGSYR
jgi:DNA polymerase/3'-5' exonuclease PolX